MELKLRKDIVRTRQHKILEWSFVDIRDVTQYIEIDIVYERDDDSTMLLYTLMNGNGVGFQGMEIKDVKEYFEQKFTEFVDMLFDYGDAIEEDNYEHIIKEMLTAFNRAIDCIME